MNADKIRENRLRRAAERQGLKLVKSKRRDPRALDYAGWMITNAQTGSIEAGSHGLLNLDEVERFLNASHDQEGAAK